MENIDPYSPKRAPMFDAGEAISLIALKRLLTPIAYHRLAEITKTVALGLVSGVLYLFLFHYESEVTELALLTRAGHKLDALAPVGIALVFSLVHGAFTGRFWDALGIRAKRQNQDEQVHAEIDD